MVNNIVLSGMAWVSSIKDAIAERISEESGQDLIEYAVLAGAIGIVAAVALFGAAAVGGVSVGDAIANFRDTLATCIDISSGSCPTG